MATHAEAILGALGRLRARGMRAARAVRVRFLRTRFTSPPATVEERRRSYQRDGFVAGGPLLDAQRVERLCSEFDRIFAARDDATGIRHKRVDDGAGGEYFTVYTLHRLSPEFRELVTDPRLVEMLAQLTGRRAFRVLLDQIQYKPPTTGGWNHWHRDMPSFPLMPPYTALTAWIALDDATQANGCLHMVPGSHLWGDASDLAGDGWGLARLPRVYRGHPVRVVPRPVRRGHVHFHNELVWHNSSPNRTRQKRRALAVLYVGAEDRYRKGGRLEFPELSHGAPLDAVAPLVVTARAG